MESNSQEVTAPTAEAYIDQAVETQNQRTVTPADEQGGNVTLAQDVPETTSEGTLPTEALESEEQESIRDKRYAGKLRQIEDELKREKEEKQALSQKFDKVVEHVGKTPEKYAEALMDTNGWTKEQADAYVSNLKLQGHWSNPQPNQQQVNNQQMPAQNFNPDRAIDEALDRREATTALMDAYPELKNSNSTNNENFRKAWYLAHSWQSADPTINLKEALIQQYGQITRKSADQVKEATETGRIQGIAEATIGRATTQSSPVGVTTKQPTYNLTADQKERAKQWRMSDEEMFRFSNEKITSVG